MEISKELISGFIQSGGVFAPILFIIFHLLRPLLFLPVVLFCILGGIIFGVVAGTIYSIVGITLSSLLFYYIVKKTPKTLSRINQLKDRLLGKEMITSTTQITLLRLVPFIHFNLLSICLIDLTANVREYTKSSFYTSIPFTIVYTSMGQWILTLTPTHILLVFMTLIPILYFLRKKEFIIKWDEFFHAKV